MAQIFHIENGHAEVTLDGRKTTLKSGVFLYIPPRIVHGFTFATGTEGVVLSVPSPVVSRLGPRSAALTEWLATPQRGSMGTDTAQLLSCLNDAFSRAGTFRAPRLVSLTHAILANLADDSATTPARSPASTQVMRLDALIADHVTDGWCARDYASELSMTAGHLNRLVRTARGMSLTAYLETAVMTEACRQIAFTRLPIGEVGYRLGYMDPPYFSRRFRARIGETPSQYRARVSGETS
ncbi:helix-turn-helix domain-containing protein [Celeribacter arenosi]|uniref:Helix-turn-helix domain-containing protein n=2 Tax=Celeribacter arenosi TaxID=792649 RepID=A0ABP7KGL2_9RHOB